MNRVFYLIGGATFVVFLLACVAVRIGSTPSPYRAIARFHFRFGALYFILSMMWIFTHSAERWNGLHFLGGFYLYFALQYAFFTHLFATVIRGFSTNICVVLYRLGGRGRVEDVARDYADGKGIEYVKAERISVLLQSGAIREADGKLILTPFGRRTAQLNRIILAVWGLGYLGVGQSETHS